MTKTLILVVNKRKKRLKKRKKNLKKSKKSLKKRKKSMKKRSMEKEKKNQRKKRRHKYMKQRQKRTVGKKHTRMDQVLKYIARKKGNPQECPLSPQKRRQLLP